MRRAGIPLAIVLCALSAGRGLAQGDPRSAFTWRQPIRGALETGALYRLHLPPEVFDGCKAFPADLRILDPEGREWPFFLGVPPEEAGELPRRATVLGETFVTSGARYLEIDLRVEPRDRENRPKHDRVTVHTTGRDFLRRVEVLGSEDGSVWIPRGAGYLVEQDAREELLNRVLTYGVTDEPFLRLHIHPDAKNEGDLFSVQHVAVALLEDAQAELEEVPMEPIAVPEAERKPGVQVVLLDAGVRNRPLRRLRIEAEGRNFALPVKVYGRPAETNGWRWVADGGIQRWGAQVRDRVDLKGTTFRFFRVELYHYENEPVEIKRVIGFAVPHTLVFRAESTASPYLFYGGVGVSLPHYDLQRETPERASASARVVTLGEQQINPQRLARGLQSYGHWLTMMAAGVMVLLAVVTVVHLLRRRFGG